MLFNNTLSLFGISRSSSGDAAGTNRVEFFTFFSPPLSPTHLTANQTPIQLSLIRLPTPSPRKSVRDVKLLLVRPGEGVKNRFLFKSALFDKRARTYYINYT